MARKGFVLANNPLASGPALFDRERSGIPYRELPLAAVDRDPNQPRNSFDEAQLNELAQSIKTYGVLSPVLVRPSKIPGRYQLISGERRVRACELAGLRSVPALVDSVHDSTGERTLAIQLVENIQRAELSSLERAHAIGALREAHGLSVREIAQRLGISKSMVQRSFEILELPDDLLNALRQGASESKVLLLAKIEDEDVRASYLKDLDVLTRSKLKGEVSKTNSDSRASANALSSEDQRIADELQRALGLKVKLTRTNPEAESGRLILEFYSSTDLQELCRKLIAEEV